MKKIAAFFLSYFQLVFSFLFLYNKCRPFSVLHSGQCMISK